MEKKPTQTVISASFTGKINTGSYENESPFYSISETYTDVLQDGEIKQRQSELHKYCYEQFKKHEEQAKIDRIQKEYQHLRFYEIGEGKRYPSVTTVIGWDADFFMPADQLQQHASRGSIIDKQIQIFLETGEWREPKLIPEIYPDLKIVKAGNLKLELDDSNFRGFYEKYPFRMISCQTLHINNDLEYAGTSDIVCVIDSKNKGDWEKIEGVIFDVPTILDVKCGSMDKTKFMKQITAYAKCSPEIKQIGIIHLNKENKCGFSKGIIEKDLEKYWSLFLDDRNKFRKRYGV